MANIFISYSRKDKPRVRAIADALSGHRWSVWWDHEIPTGRTFDQVIADALAGARSVVVVWSKESIGSDWVREEAEEGRKREILIPVRIDDVRPPLGFGRIQAADLAEWDGTATADVFQKLVRDIASIVGPPQPSGRRITQSDAPAAETHASIVGTLEPVPPVIGSPQAHEEGRQSVESVWHRVFARHGKGVRQSLAAILVLAGLAILAVGLYRLWPGEPSQPRPTAVASAEPGLQLNAVLNERGKPLATGVSCEVHEAARDVEGKRKRVTGSASYEGPPRFPLPAGRYHVVAASDGGRGEAEVAVSAGKVQQLQLRLSRSERR